MLAVSEAIMWVSFWSCLAMGTLYQFRIVPIGKSFKGLLSDISVGGLSFEIRISKEETARLLLGRKISVAFNYTKHIPNISIDQIGTIVGIYPFPFEDYSIHVKFDKMLDRSVIEAIKKCF